MKIVIAIDSFKGSLSSIDAGKAVEDAIKEVQPSAQVEVVSLADGGEGTVDSLVLGTGGVYKTIKVTGPLGDKVDARYGIINGDTCALEVASACGITLVKKERLNPIKATTFGVGEVILDALSNGCKKFIIGLGGSATNDCGVGMLQALGFSFLDDSENEVGFGADGVGKICKISSDKADIRLKDCEFQIACDVKNPLVGALGCSEIFSRQKGATDEQVKVMDKYLDNFSSLYQTINETADKCAEGVGAAGGLGYAFKYFLNGKMSSGINLIIDKIGLEEKVKTADLVITGEGRLDSQSAMGKAPIGVAKLAKKYGKKVVAFCGSVGNGAEEVNLHGVDAFFSIVNSPCTLETAMDTSVAYNNLKSTAKQVIRLWQNI